MPGGLSKLGRSGGKSGGSGAGGSRNRGFFPPPRQRIPSVASFGRISLAGSRQRDCTTLCSGKAAAEPEETFSLVPGKNPPAFAMIIRLAPGLVEEIRRLEEQGGTARIKFDAFLKNSNVINVGGKEYKFTWSPELGALCDIYEECQSGEDGNCLLINSGCSWRKLNVQRVLDESTTNHVKMRSAEAARKSKSRKTITLDARSPSLMKQLPLAETNTCTQMMSYKLKKEPPLKKRKVDPPQVQDKSLRPVVLGLVSISAGKGSVPKSYSGNEGTTQNQVQNNEISVKAERDSQEQINIVVGKKAEQRAHVSSRPNDLQIVLINLLKEAPMSLKALEKAVADVIPKPAKKIKKILGNIATFQAPGIYFLKPELDLQGVKKPLSGSGSSAEQNNLILPASNQDHVQVPVPELSAAEKTPVVESDGQIKENLMQKVNGEVSNAQENVEHFPCIFWDDNRHDIGDRSLDGNENGSSLNSEASTKVMKRLDKVVNNVSDSGGVSKNKLGSFEQAVSALSLPCHTDGNRTVHNETAAKQNNVGYDAVDISCSDSDIRMPTPSKAQKATEGIPERRMDDPTRCHTEVPRTDQYHLRGGCTDVVSQEVELVDAIQRGVSEDYRECQKDSPVSAQQQQGGEQGQLSHSLRVCRTDTSNAIVNLADDCPDTTLKWGDGIGQKDRESSLDEDESVYLKYEKEKPEPKGPINDVSQYKECVQEYRDKYKSYSSLIRILEGYRNDFQKLGEDLQFARGKDMHRYDKVMALLKKSYLEGGERHKRLKKIFVVLHEELTHLKQRLEDYASSHGKPNKKFSSTGFQDK